MLQASFLPSLTQVPGGSGVKEQLPVPSRPSSLPFLCTLPIPAPKNQTTQFQVFASSFPTPLKRMKITLITRTARGRTSGFPRSKTIKPSLLYFPRPSLPRPGLCSPFFTILHREGGTGVGCRKSCPSRAPTQGHLSASHTPSGSPAGSHCHSSNHWTGFQHSRCFHLLHGRCPTSLVERKPSSCSCVCMRFHPPISRSLRCF